MELPIFLLNDVTGGASAYFEREMLDAAIVTPEDAPNLSAWGTDGERLEISVHDGRWQIAPQDPPVRDIELLRDLLRQHLKFWNEPSADRVARHRIIERAGAFFKVRKPRSRWAVFFDQFSRFPWLGPN